jgi:hypothetical protein
VTAQAGPRQMSFVTFFGTGAGLETDADGLRCGDVTILDALPFSRMSQHLCRHGQVRGGTAVPSGSNEHGLRVHDDRARRIRSHVDAAGAIARHSASTLSATTLSA